MASISYRLNYPASVQRMRDASLELIEKAGRPRKDFKIAMDLLVGDFDQGREPGRKAPIAPDTYSYTVLDIISCCAWTRGCTNWWLSPFLPPTV